MVQLGDIAFVLKFFARNLITVNTQRAQKMRMARWMHKMGKKRKIKNTIYREWGPWSVFHGLRRTWIFTVCKISFHENIWAGKFKEYRLWTNGLTLRRRLAWVCTVCKMSLHGYAEWTVQKVMCSPCVPLMGRGNMRRLLEVCMFNIVPPGCTDWHGCTAKFWVKCLNTI